MKTRMTKKLTALFVMLCMIASVMPSALAAGVSIMSSGDAAAVNSVNIDGGTVNSAEVTVVTPGTYTVYAAVYEESALQAADVKTVTFSSSMTNETVAFDNAISFDRETETLKCYIWDDKEPVSAAYTYTPADEGGGDEETEKFTVTFTIDANAYIIVSETQDFDDPTALTVGAYGESLSAYARNKKGVITTTVTDAQLNFKVITADGYRVYTVSADGTYKNLKDPDELGENTYRITQVGSDITVNITTGEYYPLSGEIETDEGESVVTAFRYSDETANGMTYTNTDGLRAASLTTSNDGGILTVNTTDYMDDGYLRTSAVFTPQDVNGTKLVWSEDSSYIQTVVDATGFEDLYVSAKTAATKKGPSCYKIQYSLDGTTFTDIAQSDALASNKTLTAVTVSADETAVTKFALPSEASEAETLYIRIVPNGTATVGGGELADGSGEFAVNDLIIYGTKTENYVEEPVETGDDIIHLADNSIVALSSSGVTIANVTVDNANNTVKITPSANGETYTFDGSLTDGQIIVTAGNKKYETTLVLDGVSVSCSTGSPLYVTEGKTIIDTNNTDSTFTCTAAEYASDNTTAQETAAINTKRDTTIQGGGSVTATSSNGNAIHCKKDLTIGDTDVTATGGNNGIKGKQSVTIAENAGNITVTSVKDGITSDYAPEIDTTANTVAASLTDMGTDAGGAVTINGGTITVTTTGTEKTGDGIQADALLTINGGDITINATGEALKANCSQLDYADAADYSTYSSALAAYNGCINITGGSVNATAGEDAVKATKDITVSGGNVIINSAGDDGLQAGDVVINELAPSSSQRIDGTVTVSDGTINIKNATGDGIAATLTYEQTGGSVTAVAAKDGVQAGKAYTYYDIHGSGDDETILYETNGVVNITGGSLTITAAGGATRSITDNDGNTTLNDINYSCKGIKARKLINISGGTLNVNALDDALHSNHTMRISGGDITVKSCDDGVHGEYYLYISDDAKIDVQKSYEGIEGSKIYISGGETYVVAADDGANAAGDEPTDEAITLSGVYSLSSDTATYQLMAGPGGWSGGPGMNDNSAAYGYMEVSGGLLYIEAEGDGFDTNGSGLIKDGIVLVNGPTSGGNGVFDKGDNSGDTLVITGGTVIGAGTSDMAVTPDSTTGSQAYVVTTVSTQSAGKAIQVLNGSNEVISYIPSMNYAWIFVSTPSISSGTSYTVKYGGTVSGGTWGANYNETYGIKTGVTFSGGSTATVTAATSGGSSSSGGGTNPGQGGPGGRP